MAQKDMREIGGLTFAATDSQHPCKCVTHTPTLSSASLRVTLTKGLMSSFSGHWMYEWWETLRAIKKRLMKHGLGSCRVLVDRKWRHDIFHHIKLSSNCFGLSITNKWKSHARVRIKRRNLTFCPFEVRICAITPLFTCGGQCSGRPVIPSVQS